MSRLPPWIRLSLTTDQRFGAVHSLVGQFGLHTVCESAKCPNRHECWNGGTATLMLLGDTCTRNCSFCAIKAGRPPELDLDEPRRAALAAQAMKLRHVVLTSVARDDLDDGGSGIFAETIGEMRKRLPEASIEVLTPDFEGVEASMAKVLTAHPDVFNHNIESVRRLQPVIRPQASYGRSLAVLRFAAHWRPGVAVKSGIMTGLGETDDEIHETMRDLLDVGCHILTIGQYLRPTRNHPPVERYVEPEQFREYERVAYDLGFKAVTSGPMVRSSYKAEDAWLTVKESGVLDREQSAVAG